MRKKWWVRNGTVNSIHSSSSGFWVRDLGGLIYCCGTYPSVAVANSTNSDSVRCFANWAAIFWRSWLSGRPKVIIESNRLNENTSNMLENTPPAYNSCKHVQLYTSSEQDQGLAFYLLLQLPPPFYPAQIHQSTPKRKNEFYLRHYNS